jgi:hypothetical protein
LPGISAVIGTIRKHPKKAWTDGPANEYLFHPNENGTLFGLGVFPASFGMTLVQVLTAIENEALEQLAIRKEKRLLTVMQKGTGG